LFTIWGKNKGSAVLALGSRRWDMVLPATTFAAALVDAASMSGVPARAGRLLLVDTDGGLRAAPFDPGRPSPTTTDALVLDNVYSDVSTESRGWLATSQNATAVYAAGNPSNTSLVWVDREGTITPIRAESDVYQEVVTSPDGTKAVVRQGLNFWIHDFERGTHVPLTSGLDSNLLPAWSPDGRRILFASNRGGDWDIYSQSVDGSGSADVLLNRPFDQFPYMVARDGTLVYTEIQPATGRDLWTLSRDGQTTPLRVTRFNELAAEFAPVAQGPPRFLAYASDESGQSEIYLQSFPGVSVAFRSPPEAASVPCGRPTGGSCSTSRATP
jgi:hypothetical protein